MNRGDAETEAGAVLFAGRSGSGKSTLLAALVERGYSRSAQRKVGTKHLRSGTPSCSGHPGRVRGKPPRVTGGYTR